MDPTSEILGELCLSIYRTGNLNENCVQLIDGIMPGTHILSRLDEFTAEEKLKIFDKLIKEFSKNLEYNEPELTRLLEFICAFLANRIGAGGTEHLSLLTPWIEILPLAPVWFGVNSALRHPELWGDEFGGLGRLILRELGYPFYVSDQPRSDIAFAELAALVDPEQGGFIRKFRGVATRALNIELVPGVHAGFQLSQQREDARSAATAIVPHQRVQDIRRAIETVLVALGDAKGMVSDLTGTNWKPDSSQKKSQNRSTKGRGKASLKNQKEKSNDPKLL